MSKNIDPGSRCHHICSRLVRKKIPQVFFVGVGVRAGLLNLMKISLERRHNIGSRILLLTMFT